MDLPSVYENSQLAHIIEQAMICQCACPAQVAQELLGLRELFRYQRNCSVLRKDDAGAHVPIMASLRVAHAKLETCLGDVLAAEGWNPATLSMPEGLRQLRDDLLR